MVLESNYAPSMAPRRRFRERVLKKKDHRTQITEAALQHTAKVNYRGRATRGTTVQSGPDRVELPVPRALHISLRRTQTSVLHASHVRYIYHLSRTITAHRKLYNRPCSKKRETSYDALYFSLTTWQEGMQLHATWHLFVFIRIRAGDSTHKT